MVRVALLVVVLALAGCTDADPVVADTPDDAPVVDVPTWEIGQYWSYRGDQGDFRLVVSEAGSQYILDTDDDELALFAARQDVSFLGPIRKADLSGDQDGQSVRFFQWPLEDGATWKTTWDGVERTITAAAQQDGTFRMTATEGGRTAVEYDYDPEVAWISFMSFSDENGTMGFRLDSSGTGFAGELYRWSIEAALDATWAGLGGAMNTLEVPSHVRWLEYEAALMCPDAALGQHVLQMGRGEDPTGTSHVVVMEQNPPVDLGVACPGEFVVQDRLEARAGTWIVHSAAGSEAGVNMLAVDFLSRDIITL